ncbi:MAG: amino acid permease [Candidatus Bathyarchaeia archaeon]
MSAEPRSLKKSIRLREGVFLYIGSVLGSGILVAPAIAANIAGPASLVAWVLLSFLSYPIGYTFGALAASYPDAGGLSAFIKRGFGWTAGTVGGWLFVFSFFVGAPVVAIIASSYFIISLGLSPNLLYPIAFLFISFTILINVTGIRIGSRVESVILGMVVTLLFVAVGLTLPHVQQSNFLPFAPHGWFAVGVVGVIIFWSFQGYENVPQLAEEFKNPGRDFQLSIAASATITSLLYILTSFSVIGTAIYVNQSLYAPVALMFSRSLGVSAAIITLFLAVTTCFGTMNAYSIGVSRLVYALARDGSMPSALMKLNKQAAPTRALLVLLVGAATCLVFDALIGAKLDQLFLVSGAGFIALYILGSAAAVKLLKLRGLKRVFPYVSLIVSAVVFVFVGEYALFPIVIALLSILWVKIRTARIDSHRLK